MRSLLCLLILPALLSPVWAEAAPKADAPAPHHARQTWEQRFSQANQAHDGHLTPEEAKSGFPLVARHFDDIDVDHKGYVTQNDVRAWRIMRKAAHQLAQPPEDKLKPRPAYQRQYPGQHLGPEPDHAGRAV